MNRERKYGIDALRIVSMWMIVILHVLLHGGILPNLEEGSFRYMSAWFLEAAAYGAVNAYGLISGYVGVKAKHKASGMAALWIQVAFYSVVLPMIMHVLRPELVSARRWMYGLFPVSFNLYWYYSAYFFISFLFPLINCVLLSAPKKELIWGLGAAVALISINTCVFQQDAFHVNKGFSPLWLLLLYMIGGTIRIHGASLRVYQWVRRHAMPLFLLGAAAAWGMKMLVGSDGISFVVWIPSDAWYSYTSPAILLSSAALFAFFEGLKPGERTCRWIGRIAPTTFGVYLIHESSAIRTCFIKNGFVSFTRLTAYQLPFAVLGAAAAVFAVCAAIDLLRGKLFRLLKVRERCQWAFERIGLS